MINDWVLKPGHGARLFFFFLLSSLLCVMKFIICMNMLKKEKKN